MRRASLRTRVAKTADMSKAMGSTAGRRGRCFMGAKTNKRYASKGGGVTSAKTSPTVLVCSSSRRMGTQYQAMKEIKAHITA